MMMPGAPMGAPQGSGGGDQEAFATGLLAGAGLRELSQTLGLSRKRGSSPAGAQPPAAQLAAGNMGDIDKVLLLAKLQGMLGGAPAPGMVPAPMGVNPMAAMAAQARPPMPSPMGAPGMPMAAPMGMPRPMMPGAMPAPAGPMGAPMGAPPMGGAPGGSPGGGLPMQLLQQLLSGARGVV